VKVSTRDLAAYKVAAVIFVDQLNQLYFAAELDIIESSVWFGRAARQDYWVALNLTGSSVDDSGCDAYRELRLRLRVQFYEVLQPGDYEAAGGSVRRARSGQAP
jgi:hypothetical protein